MKHSFTKKAYKHLQEVWEYTIFALNIPMTYSERQEIRSHLEAVAKILAKY